MFENLSDRLEAIYKKLKGRGVLKEADVDAALREIRVALIEADVSLSVIKPFLEDIRIKAVGQEILKSLTPGHQMVKVVNDELIALLGGEFKEITLAPTLPTIILMAGLQGAGKTTTVGKLAKRFKDKGYKDPKFLLPIGNSFVLEQVLNQFDDEDRQAIENEANSILEELQVLQLAKLGKRQKPPTGY